MGGKSPESLSTGGQVCHGLIASAHIAVTRAGKRIQNPPLILGDLLLYGNKDMKSLTKITLLFVLSLTSLKAVDFPPPGRWSDPYQAGRKPEMNVAGNYRVVEKSILQGGVSDIKPGVVYRYGNAFKGKIDGKHYWMVPVRYYKHAPSASIYTQGRVLSEVYACVNHDRVEMWVTKYVRWFGL